MILTRLCKRSDAESSSHSSPKVGKLVCQAQGVGIFAGSEYLGVASKKATCKGCFFYLLRSNSISSALRGLYLIKGGLPPLYIITL